jgi:catalase
MNKALDEVRTAEALYALRDARSGSQAVELVWRPCRHKRLSWAIATPEGEMTHARLEAAGEANQNCYSQPGLLFRLMTAEQRKALFENAVRAMGDAPEEVKLRHIGTCRKADPAYGEGVARALGISMA